MAWVWLKALGVGGPGSLVGALGWARRAALYPDAADLKELTDYQPKLPARVFSR